jgi:hypothetical protein
MVMSGRRWRFKYKTYHCLQWRNLCYMTEHDIKHFVFHFNFRYAFLSVA